MELSQQAIHDVIHPTAAFAPAIPRITHREDEEVPWDSSPLNPKNRINCLAPVLGSRWRIDGCTAYGTQYYAVPNFTRNRPLRIDVFVPELTNLPETLQDVLDVDAVFHIRDANRLSGLGITRHILRILNYWTSTLAQPHKLFDDLPFGSRIVFGNLPVDIRNADITIAPAYYVERHLLSWSDLQACWGRDVELPETVDISQVDFVSQLHDSVCLVKIAGQIWILKALANHTKFLYHELRHLLSIPAHPNVVSRPRHLVTKACSFGAKNAILGLTLEFHEHGSLRDLVPFLQMHGILTTSIVVNWSVQLASALLHLREKTATFYPDLRLDNIVLSSDGRVVMVDFEQRGVWCEFAPPEVNAFDYLRLVAIDGDNKSSDHRRCTELLEEQLPGWSDLEEGEEYRWPSDGYNVAWKCLTPTEQEVCEVYMLGRVLWCIFEGQSAPQRAAVWVSYRWESLIEFPEYRKTPYPIRGLIDRCTSGRRAGLGKIITREGNKLVMRAFGRTVQSTREQIQESARQWWRAELREAEDWVRDRAEGMKRGDWNENFYQRPTLREVHNFLREYQRTEGFGDEPQLAAALKEVLSRRE